VLRSGSRRWPPRYETLNEAKTEKKENKSTGRQAQHYACQSCKEDFPAKGVCVDHIRPVVDPVQGFTTWDEFIQRLYCPKENLQVLCIECHKVKTKKESSGRKKSNQDKKG